MKNPAALSRSCGTAKVALSLLRRCSNILTLMRFGGVPGKLVRSETGCCSQLQRLLQLKGAVGSTPTGIVSAGRAEKFLNICGYQAESNIPV
jgi:hypothetical protein